MANSLFKYLQKIYKVVGDCVQDCNGNPERLFLQDSFMKDTFNCYPERLSIDCSFIKFDIDLYITFFVCENGNGNNYIIAIGFLQCKDADSLKWLFCCFKKYNPNWRKIRCIAVDPFIHDWELVQESFPYSVNFICAYHAIKTFKNTFNSADMKQFVTKEDTEKSLYLFKNLVYAVTNSDFEMHFEKFKKLPTVFVSYFLEFWKPLERRWRIPLDFTYEDVFKSRNVYLEQLNCDVEMISEIEKNYIEFIKKIFLMILLKKKERQNENINGMKPVAMLYSRFSTEYEICKTLTPYAAEFVIKQLDLSKDMTIDFIPFSEYYVFNLFDLKVQTSSVTCYCNFHLYTSLPCRHIFTVRRINNFCLFDRNMNYACWSNQYYEHCTAGIDGYLTNNIDNRIPHDLDSRTVLASHLFEITTPLLLDLPKDEYESRIKLLKNLADAWKMNDDVTIKLNGFSKSSNKDRSCASKISKLPIENCSPIPVKVHNLSDLHVSREVNLCESKSQAKAILTLKETHYSEMHVDSSYIPSIPPLVYHEPKRASRQRLYDVNHCLLNGKHINLAYIVMIICLTKESCVNWLKAQGFLPTSMKCSLCNGDMINKNLSRLNDGVTWRCMDKTCMGKKSSVRVGTWFEESNLTLQQILIFTYMWLNKFSKARILLEMPISTVNYVKWDKFYRRICEESLRIDSPNIVQANSSNYEDPLDKWLQNHAGKDTFSEFLKDIACIYAKDKEKPLLDPKTQMNDSCCVLESVAS